MSISRQAFAPVAAAALLAALATPAASAGDAQRGAALYRACAPCHSLAPGENMTGPSLAGLWDRKAGSLSSFDRYSPALKSAGLVWDEKSLDAWLKSPQSLIPQNRMTFPGMPDAAQRADLIAFLKQAGGGGMTNAMAGAVARGFQDLKKLGADHRVRAIGYCRSTYHVTTEDGRTADFWEANLRFKTDASDTGPVAGKPVILPAG